MSKDSFSAHASLMLDWAPFGFVVAVFGFGLVSLMVQGVGATHFGILAFVALCGMITAINVIINWRIRSNAWRIISGVMYLAVLVWVSILAYKHFNDKYSGQIVFQYATLYQVVIYSILWAFRPAIVRLCRLPNYQPPSSLRRHPSTVR